MEQEIMNLIVAITPALTSIAGIVGAVVTMIKKVKKIDDSHSQDIAALNAKMNIVLQENAELKQEIKKYTKLVYRVNEGENNVETK